MKNPKANSAVGASGVGGALGVLTVIFLPETWHVFTPEEAAIATAAFGTVFAALVRYLPGPS